MDDAAVGVVEGDVRGVVVSVRGGEVSAVDWRDGVGFHLGRDGVGARFCVRCGGVRRRGRWGWSCLLVVLGGVR